MTKKSFDNFIFDNLIKKDIQKHTYYYIHNDNDDDNKLNKRRHIYKKELK